MGNCNIYIFCYHCMPCTFDVLPPSMIVIIAIFLMCPKCHLKLSLKFPSKYHSEKPTAIIAKERVKHFLGSEENSVSSFGIA